MRDFSRADELKEQLFASGIGLFDSDNRWVAFDRSISGSIPFLEMQSIPCTLTIDEVQTMINDRTAARRVRLQSADAIKNDLLREGYNYLTGKISGKHMMDLLEGCNQ